METIKCPQCNFVAYKIDEYGGMLNGKRTPLVNVYSCCGCGREFEILSNGEFRQFEYVLDCVDFIGSNQWKIK